MASQPSRPWFRLGSIVRPVSTPTPAPAPAPMVIPSMRPVAPPPEPTPPPLPPPTTTALPPPPPPAAVAPPPDATAPPSPPPPAATPSPPPPPRVTTSSVPSSPVNKASVPSSPVNKAASSSVPSSPATRVSGAPSYSGVPSPTRTKATTTSTTTSVPNSPANKPQTPSTSSPKPAISTNSPPSYKPLPPHTYSPPKPTTISSTAREANNYNQSPKTIRPAVNQTPPQSPKLKQTAPPPSPLTLPLSQLRPNTSDNQTDQPKFPIEAEQKTVLVQQKTIDQQKPNSWFSSFTSGNLKGADFRESPKPSNNSLSSKNEGETKERLISHKKSPSSSDHEAAGMRVITVAGENRGALMELIKSPKKHGSGEHSHYIHKKGNGKTLMGNQSDQSSYSSSSSRDSGGEEGKHKSKDKSHRAGKAAASKPTSAFMNSNVQGINNSIVYNSSLTHHDPGVHLAFSRKPNGEGFEAKSHHANGRNS